MAKFLVTRGGQTTIRVENGALIMPETVSTPATIAGKGQIYIKSDGIAYYLDSSGTETNLI